MDTKKICVCVPTYNSPENMKRYIDEQINIFQRHDIDLHIYDSSEKADTENIVREYRKDGYVNLFYHKIASEVPSNRKVYMIFQEGSKSAYEYVWMIHDHTICTEAALSYLLSVIEKKEDFYVLNMQSNGERVEAYSSLDEFLVGGAWRLNSFGASVIRVDTFLKDVDWERISEKYNDEITLSYSHIGFYFERASEIKEIRACEVHFDRKDFIDFRRGEKINWSRDTIRICMECWGNVIMRLPDAYQKKQEALKTQDRWFMSKYSLISYKKNGIYGLKCFFKYRKWIKAIYPEDYIRDLWIAALPYKLSLSIFTRDLDKKIKCIQKQNGDVYIYGAGRHAIECGQFLDEQNIDFKGYIVTNAEGNPPNIGIHKVEPINEELFLRPILVIISVLTSGVSGVIETLEKFKNKNTDFIVFGE